MSFFPTRQVALEILGFSIHWYGLLYLTAFLLTWFLLPRLEQYRGLRFSSEQRSELLSVGILGVLIGGRLGYVFLYDPIYFLQRPLEVFFVWNGGMASHGGFIGVILAVYLYCRKKNIDLWKLADIAVVPAAIGLALGRLGNFINLELYGAVTSLPWGISIPGVEGLRHPTQIYAVCKDLFIAGVCFLYLVKIKPAKPGRTFALFLILYSILRFLLEYIKHQNYPLVDLKILLLSWGQIYTIPLFIAGIILWRWRGNFRQA
jgi:phosphatidylglycerol:prolipoprotein diacylglycerol transferase